MSIRSTESEEKIIYNGSRGSDFKELIFNLLKEAKLKMHYIKVLLDDDSMAFYSKAFTSDTADIENNYEVFEQLGDISANKFIVHHAE